LKNILLNIEYDGTRYKGWQKQPEVPTVEATLQEVLQQICQCSIQVRAGSRTDSGVHARGQAATVLIPRRIPLDKLLASTNALLPDDISISKAVEVAQDFSARRNNCGKRYIYQICNGPVADALQHRFFHWIKSPLDLTCMQKAAAMFLGTHDFSAFRGKGCQQLSTQKTITKIHISRQNGVLRDIIRITVEGDGFLKNQVRIMVGTLIDIGRNRLADETIRRALNSRRREQAGITAPAKGLILDAVFFVPDPFQSN